MAQSHSPQGFPEPLVDLLLSAASVPIASQSPSSTSWHRQQPLISFNPLKAPPKYGFSSIPTMRFPLIAPIVLLCMHTSQAAAAAVTSKLETRQTNDFLFKGEKIPAVNWTSNDISNFTLGLTGVNNYENFAFGYKSWTLGPTRNTADVCNHL